MKKTLKILWCIWGVSYLLLSLFGFICVYIVPDSFAPMPLEQGSMYQYILMGSIVFYFAPILLLIRHFSRNAGNKTSMIASTAILAFKLIWLICAVISLL